MSSAQVHERTVARRSAAQLLYMAEILGKSINEVLDNPSSYKDEVNDNPYMYVVLEGIQAHDDLLRALLSDTSQNWTLSRMPIMDRCVLRIASYEMIFQDDVPVSVAINEAVELAKDFGGDDDSHRFVNGILGRIATLLEEEGKDALIASYASSALKDSVQAEGE